MEELRAVIYVPAGVDAARWLRECRDHCARRGYQVVAVAHGAESATEMWREDQADVLIVARPEHVRALATATEVVTEEDQQDRQLPRQWRRTRRRKRGPAER